ncbi:MAG: hypothetical protein J6R00_08235, partial [Lentisphaeria bacterium]|nr:hypothetical protein [Lentisphaeria bacterium]
RVRSAVAKAMAGQGEKNNEADVRLLFSRKEVFPLSPHHLPISGTKLIFLLVLSRKGDILSSAVKLQHERVKNGTVQAGIY